jgi:hypothetical protein
MFKPLNGKEINGLDAKGSCNKKHFCDRGLGYKLRPATKPGPVRGR